MPTFPLYSNPTISLDEIMNRRFERNPCGEIIAYPFSPLRDLRDEQLAAYTGMNRPGVGTIKHWPEWKFELWDRKTA